MKDNIFSIVRDIIVSLISAAIFYVLDRVISITYIWPIISALLTTLLIILLIRTMRIKNEISNVYINNVNLHKKILKSLIDEENISILVMKGDLFTLSDKVLFNIFSHEYRNKTIKFLMSNPSSNAITIRANEIPDRLPEHLQIETEISLETLKRIREHNNNLFIKVHNENVIYRLIITSKIMYVSFFIKGQYANDTPFYAVKKGSLLYKSLEKYYDDIWNAKSTPVE